MVKKKFFAVALVGIMTTSMCMGVSAQHLTGTEWWKGETGDNYTLGGNGEISFEVECEKDVNGYAEFSVEVTGEAEGKYACITTGSDKNAWYFGDTMKGDAITGIADKFESTIKAGETYTIKVVRNDSDITVTYLKSSGETYAEFKALNTTLDSKPINVHVIAQVGEYEVGSDQEILAGTAWWNDGKEVGQNYELSGDGKTELYLTYKEQYGNVDPAFNVEVVDSTGKGITTGSLRDSWFFGTTELNNADIVIDKGTGNLEVGKTYRIVVEREGKTIIITYYNPDGTKYVSFSATTNFDENIKTHVIAQLGTYTVSQKMTVKTEEAFTYAQYKANANGTYTVRIVSEVAMADVTKYVNVGFRCSKLATKAGENYYGMKVYKSIKANGKTVTAADGKYFVILEINNVVNTAKLYAEPVYQDVTMALGSFGKEVTVDMASLLK